MPALVSIRHKAQKQNPPPDSRQDLILSAFQKHLCAIYFKNAPEKEADIKLCEENRFTRAWIYRRQEGLNI